MTTPVPTGPETQQLLPTSANLILISNPFRFWPFNDGPSSAVVNDPVSNIYGSVNGGVTLGTTDPWGDPFAATFDGTTGYVSDADTAFLGQNPWTIAIWYKTANAPGGMLCYVGSASTSYPYQTFTPSFYLNGTGLLCLFASPLPVIQSQTASNDGNWHLATGTWDGNATMSLFQDGLFVSNGTGSIVPVNGGWVAGNGGNANRGGWWNGQLTQRAVWNRILTNAEINTLAATILKA